MAQFKNLKDLLKKFSDEQACKIKDNERFELTLLHLEGSIPYKKLVAKKYDIYGETKEFEQTPEE